MHAIPKKEMGIATMNLVATLRYFQEKPEKGIMVKNLAPNPRYVRSFYVIIS